MKVRTNSHQREMIPHEAHGSFHDKSPDNGQDYSIVKVEQSNRTMKILTTEFYLEL